MKQKYWILGAFALVALLLVVVTFPFNKAPSGGSSDVVPDVTQEPDQASTASKVKGLFYEQARETVLKDGWLPIENPVPEDLVLRSEKMYSAGYVEVDVCSPIGDFPCKFYFKNAGGQYLKIITEGEDPFIVSVEIVDNETYQNTRIYVD